MNHTKLELAYYEAQDAWRKVRDSRDDERRTLISAATAEIDADLDRKYGERIQALKAAEVAAEAEYNAERVATATPPYPVGTVLIGWKDVAHSYARAQNWQAVAKGVVEIADGNTVYPANTKSAYKHAHGTVLVRLLRKDGTPGPKVERLGDWPHKWLPEGKKP